MGGKASIWPHVLSFIGGIIAALLVFLTGLFDREVQNREVDVEEMKVAFEVLKLPAGQAGGYRAWACEVLNHHSEPELDCESEEVRRATLGDLGAFRGLDLGERVEGDPAATDVDVFVCDEGQPLEVARAAAAALGQAGFGTIRLKAWSLFSEIPLDALEGRTTLVVDEDHPEADEVQKIEAALADVSGLPPVVQRANAAGLSRWYIPVIICPAE